MTSKIFISYRRTDTGAAAGRLYDFLEAKFGEQALFKDVDNIPYGRDFREEIRNAIDASVVVLVVIGRYFLTEEKRLFNENDYVRYEISYALQQGKIVIPVIVNDAVMPSPNQLPEEIIKLSTIHGPELRNNKWRRDCEDFYEQLKVIYDADDTVVLKRLEEARALYEDEKYQEAFSVYEPLFESDLLTAEDQKNIGYSFGVQQDYKKALKWYRKAAEQGNALAQANLGVMYRNGYGVEQNDNEAVKWYCKAAEQGGAMGQGNLGFMYDKGYGVQQDYHEAVKWYRKAAEQGNATGQANLGFMYDKGFGVQQDYHEAMKWYRKAAEQGYARGQNNLGVMYENGDGAKKDIAEAKKWYQKAAEQGYEPAQKSLKRLNNN